MLVKLFYLIIVLLMLISCVNNVVSTNIVSDPPQIELRNHTILREQLEKNSTVTIDSIDFGADLLVIIDYPKKKIDQVALLAMLAKEWAPLIFSHEEPTSFTLFNQLGSDHVDAQHFIKIKKEDWLNFSDVKSVFDWYNLASHYYIGPAIEGDLTFKLGNVDVYLPVQKPIN